MQRIKINGTEYDYPDVESLTMDEAIIVRKYAGVSLEELETSPDANEVGIAKALTVIAILRAEPDVSEDEAASVVGKMRLGDFKPTGSENRPQPPASSVGDANGGLSGNDGGSELDPSLASAQAGASGQPA